MSAKLLVQNAPLFALKLVERNEQRPQESAFNRRNGIFARLGPGGGRRDVQSPEGAEELPRGLAGPGTE